MDAGIREMNAVVEKESIFAKQLIAEVGKVIVGQKYLVEHLIMSLLANGHVLIEGVPGLAKTLAVKTLAQCIGTGFQRLQFTPDLLPADLIGTLVYNPKTGEFTTKKGPIFTNLILADEINRAPAKVQSALLEAMQERQVTIGQETFPLADPFLVLATQNPIEQEGTYPLPEAQLDRFMFKLKVTYPNKEEEREILERMTTGKSIKVSAIISPQDIMKARDVTHRIYVDVKVKDYIVEIVHASREPEHFGLDIIKDLISYGASPRATIYLTLAAKAQAFLRGRGFVTPDDVKAIGPDVLRHRIITSYEAEAEGVSTDTIVRHIFDKVEVP